MATTPQTNGIQPSATTTARDSPQPTPARAQSFLNPPQPQSTSNSNTISTQPQNSSNNTTNNPFDPIAQPTAPRPHDARTIHLILASLGVTAYQERVPLQLLDFAYRYTAGILGDAAHLAAEGYTTPDPASTAAGGPRGNKNKQSNEGDVTLPAMRLATSSRLGYQFAGSLPKQALLEVAEERNRIRLPDVSQTKVFGVRLPEERFLLSNRAWGILEEDIDEEEMDESAESSQTMGREEADAANGTRDEVMADEDEAGEEEDEDEEDEDQEGYQAVFGKEKEGEEDGEKMDEA